MFMDMHSLWHLQFIIFYSMRRKHVKNLIYIPYMTDMKDEEKEKKYV